MSKREAGEGTYYNENGRYCWRLRSNGEVVATVKRRTASERKTAVDRIKKQLEAGGGKLPERNTSTVGDWLEWWLEHIVKPSKSYSTWRQYEQQVRLYLKPLLGKVRLSKLTSGHIRQMMAAMPAHLSPRSREIALVTLKKALNDATREMPPLLQINPAEPVAAPKKGPQVKRTLRPDAMAVFNDAAPTAGRYGPMTLLLLTTGVRISEACGWKWEDFDPFGEPRPSLRVLRRLEWYPRQKDEDGNLTKEASWALVDVKKPKSRRTIALGKLALDALGAIRKEQMAHKEKLGKYWPNHGLILTAETGEPVIARNVQRALDNMLTESGLAHISLHDLRKSAGTHLARKGVPMHVVQEFLGHEDISTTARHYLEVASEDMADASKHFD